MKTNRWWCDEQNGLSFFGAKKIILSERVWRIFLHSILFPFQDCDNETYFATTYLPKKSVWPDCFFFKLSCWKKEKKKKEKKEKKKLGYFYSIIRSHCKKWKREFFIIISAPPFQNVRYLICHFLAPWPLSDC